jgi:hypothetical protein
MDGLDPVNTTYLTIFLSIYQGIILYLYRY